MAQMKFQQEQKLPLPSPRPALRENGDAVVELVQDGQVVGELNFTKIITNWWIILTGARQPAPQGEVVYDHGKVRGVE
jgi:hypothetical protein